MHCLYPTPLLVFPIILYSSHSSQCDQQCRISTFSPHHIFRSVHSTSGLAKYVAQSSHSYLLNEKTNVSLYIPNKPCVSLPPLNFQFLIRRQLNDQDDQSCRNTTQFKTPQSLNKYIKPKACSKIQSYLTFQKAFMLILDS